MAVLTVNNISVAFPERTLFENISFNMEYGDKIGLIGANGAGKTTLFRIITGQMSPSCGGISKSKDTAFGYMEQHSCSTPDRTVYDELLSIFQPLIDDERRLEVIAHMIESDRGDVDELVAEQFKVRERFERDGGLTYVSRTRAALLGLGFSEKEFDMPTERLSGGQRSKLCLAKLLLSGADLLLLDEPTNHLDIAAVNWLEGFVKEYRGSVLIVSHDRYFLDAVTNKTLEIEHGRSQMYIGSYSTFMEKKRKQQEILEQQYENQLKEIKRVEGIVEQQKRWGQARNFVTAASKQKQVDRLKEDLVEPGKELEQVNFKFTPKCESGNDVLICTDLAKSFGDKKLFDNVNIHIRRGERVFLLGENGCGKTTLFKILQRVYSQDSGSVVLGANVEVGYFDQVQSGLTLDKSAFSEVWDEFPYMTETEVRTVLGRFLFKGDTVFRQLKEMSGGERAKIALMKLMLKGGNFLLLDEPTNHLDTGFRERLEQALADYSGTMLIISHDRYFINRLADRILVLTKNGVEEYLGNYDYYIEKSGAKTGGSIFTNSAKKQDGKKVNDYALRKEQQSNIRKLKTRLKNCESAIEKAEADVGQLQNALQEEEAAADYGKLMELTQKLDETNAQLERLYEEWEEVSELLTEE
ncbi:MAG: ABC-F family ATP-binding cassette domain-containing protein [Lachnospiraceae bacterium]|nr:ABC-F family ATP-binding cassette domain-containing protein [Lachnospiraceae bacterium]